MFISVCSPGDFEDCLFCFLLIFFQGTLLLPVGETIQFCWAKGNSGVPLEMLKTLCTPECLLKKIQITQLNVGCAKGFVPFRYKIPSHSPFQSPVHKPIPYRAETGIRNLIQRKLCQQSNKSPESAPNP